MAKRKVEVLVLSDIHLGTYGSRAKAVVQYLRTVEPEILILNGDIVDIWQFSKNYFPKAHIEVLKEILKIAMSGVPIYYITGNHDDALRRFSGFSLGNFHLVDKLILNINGKKAWFFHGDVFDASIQYGRLLAKLGGYGYSLLIVINVFINFILVKLGRERMSFSKKIKNNVKKAISFVDDFEVNAAEIAIERQYDYVACGHIHNPQIRTIENKKGQVLYLNSGDWIENCSSLEYYDEQWHIYKHVEQEEEKDKSDKSRKKDKPNSEELMQRIMEPSESVTVGKK